MIRQRRFHRDREVRWLADKKCWVVTIGKNLTKRNTLADRDWYFPGHLPKEEADKLANQKAQQWEVLCRNWHKTEQPLLEAFGEPFPTEPRWNTGLSGAAKRELTPEEVESLRRENHILEEELMEVLAEYSLRGFIDFYRTRKLVRIGRGELRHTTLTKTVQQMEQAVTYFPDDVPAKSLRAEHFRKSLDRMHDKLGPRTVRNYMSAALELLRFVYAEYMGGASIPEGIEDAAAVPKATRTDIRIYDLDEVKEFLRATKGMLSQLDIMLALNCGMYPQDIGRLLLTEIDFDDNSAFWDREKEPENPFRIHHIFWPETLRLVRRHLNDGKNVGPAVRDYRLGPDNPELLDPAKLAFLDQGKPRYWNTPSGHEKNWVSKRMGQIVPGVSFRNLRKTANQNFTDNIEHDDSHEDLMAVEELSHHFLGQTTDTLVKLYRLRKKGAYVRMNRYLAKLGDKFRADGLFEHVV